jgi:two-component system, cell cycle response regulator
MRVVLVDPSRTVLKYLTRMLKARDHDVHPFIDPREALDHIRSDLEVSALITSAEFVSMSGAELCWEVRLLAGNRRPLYIILMSSNENRENLVKALDSGADDFMGKPPVPEELYARLRAAERLTSMQSELIRLATTDPLTGVCNRRAFFETAQQICTGSRPGATLSAIMVDIDHFKQINDRYGHDVGDAAIRGVAQLAAEENALVGRLGGEEFAVLLESADLAQATELAERLRVRVNNLQIETSQGPISLTCSLGASEWEPGDTIDNLLRRADVALYAAKATGRNRVVADKDLLPGELANKGANVRVQTRDVGPLSVKISELPRDLLAG